ncbi:hypothetical protein STXM2123_4525 [Streptomyces sp. F-3]|uniref:DUF3040 domain-containing protein n=1 Tax=Streptomyces thermogriseus TaxID=75292 RepID=A0ABP4DFP0_9ACTN|nr:MULTISPECIES: DUF3040 domain-containing protein [Streptomyces]MDN5383676.1 DUF3040 domain-containing protein [Streptomyces sp. LB8]GAT83824.1 hypothetical protein STXM2123_4525 [Streptomyces sp. F-3]
MSTRRLSDHEQRILNEIERALSRDRRLARRLRSQQRSRWRAFLSRIVAYAPRAWTVVALLAVSMILLAAGIVTSAPAVIWAFAVMWPVALFAVFRLLCRWTEP